jgi:hypothetical protein
VLAEWRLGVNNGLLESSEEILDGMSMLQNYKPLLEANKKKSNLCQIWPKISKSNIFSKISLPKTSGGNSNPQNI